MFDFTVFLIVEFDFAFGLILNRGLGFCSCFHKAFLCVVSGLFWV
jgi:hypothetical protein